MDLQAKIRGKRNISHFHSHLLAEMDLQAKIRGKRNISHFHLRLLKEIDGTLSLTFPVTRSKPFTDPECDTDTREELNALSQHLLEQNLFQSPLLLLL